MHLLRVKLECLLLNLWWVWLQNLKPYKKALFFIYLFLGCNACFYWDESWLFSGARWSSTKVFGARWCSSLHQWGSKLCCSSYVDFVIHRNELFLEDMYNNCCIWCRSSCIWPLFYFLMLVWIGKLYSGMITFSYPVFWGSHWI